MKMNGWEAGIVMMLFQKRRKKTEYILFHHRVSREVHLHKRNSTGV